MCQYEVSSVQRIDPQLAARGRAHPGALSARVRLRPGEIVVAFYTSGDTRPVAQTHGDLPEATMTDMYQRLAVELASSGHAYRADSIAEATRVLRGIVGAGKRISALYLVGHGTAGDGGGFFFAGNPGPGEEFLADLDQGYFDTLDPADAPARSERNAAFIEAVARAAPASGTLNVGFLSCYAAQQGMIQRFGAALRSSPRLASRTGVHVGGYNDYFESRYTPGPGGSTIWTNRVVPSDEVSEEFDPAADATSTPMLIPPYQVEYRDPR